MTRKWWTLVVVCAATFMLLLDVSIVVVALPQIQKQLHTTFGDVQWVTDAYALSLAAVLLTSGALADRYGRKRFFLVGLVIFTAGSALCAAAQGPSMLIWSRAAQGVGGAILFATSLALLGQTFQGRERGIAFGVWGAITGIATALGPVLGGVITSDISWRAVFWVNIPIGLLAIVIGWRALSESRPPYSHRPDWIGFAILTASLVGLVYGLIRASEQGWSDHWVMAFLAAAVVLLAVFAGVEARIDHPMFDLRLLRIPTFLGSSAAAFAMNGSMFAVILYVTLYLQDALGYSASQTGVRLLLLTGSLTVASAISGRLSSRLPARWLIGPGLIIVGASLFLMGGLDGGSDWTHLIAGLLLGGAGGGMVNPPLASTAMAVVPQHQAGMASGANTTFRQIGVAVGIAAYGSMFSSAMRHGAAQGWDLRMSYAHGLNELFVVSGCLAVAGGLASIALIRTRDFAAHALVEDQARPASASALDVPQP